MKLLLWISAILLAIGLVCIGLDRWLDVGRERQIRRWMGC